MRGHKEQTLNELKRLVGAYKEGLIDTDMEGFDISQKQANALLDDFILAVENGLGD